MAYAGITGGHCFRGSGASANYYDVGGRDTAMINAVGNTFANIPGNSTYLFIQFLDGLVIT